MLHLTTHRWTPAEGRQLYLWIPWHRCRATLEKAAAFFFSETRTRAMAFSCSKTRSISFCFEPHLVGVSVMSWWEGRPSSACADVRSLLFFKLKEHTLTTFLHTAIARSTLWSFTPCSVKTEQKNRFEIAVHCTLTEILWRAYSFITSEYESVTSY